jgi:hypothetical protein
MVHMMPKLVASSFFHGSRPIRPGRMYRRASASRAMRGSALVAAAGRRTGFIKILLLLFCAACWVMRAAALAALAVVGGWYFLQALLCRKPGK